MEDDKNKNVPQFNSFENYSPKHPINPQGRGARMHKINHWLQKHRIPVIIVVLLIILGIGGGYIYAIRSLKFEVATSTPLIEKKLSVKIYSPLTGAEVSSASSKRPVTAIMIENSPDARPQSGLKESGVVFEAIAEGGITRFLTLHQEDQPQLIGPVRSLRPYYVDWLAAFNPSVAHVGGSAKALAEIRNGSYRDIDQFFNGNSYWRAKDRYAPHNVYTSFDKLDALNQKKGYTSSDFSGFPRVAPSDRNPTKKTQVKAGSTPPSAANPATKINVTISSPLYNSSYTYDATSGLYTRSEGGKIHADREAGPIMPKVVIVIESPVSQVFEDGYRESYQTIGTGKAYVFQNGSVTTGNWTKTAKTSQIKFTDTAGKEILLERGQTWITAIDPGKSVTWQ